MLWWNQAWGNAVNHVTSAEKRGPGIAIALSLRNIDQITRWDSKRLHCEEASEGAASLAENGGECWLGGADTGKPVESLIQDSWKSEVELLRLSMDNLQAQWHPAFPGAQTLACVVKAELKRLEHEARVCR
ncbi:unnamed protein product [Symbiodinium natans]|uniref:Uncharacterized protein n=1 Tax=Symbiodinium natans TaxID=878477 RepID=A0A812IBC1_9DINO|nr:unnamed protein product [Symbiodinium natans]